MLLCPRVLKYTYAVILVHSGRFTTEYSHLGKYEQ